MLEYGADTSRFVWLNNCGFLAVLYIACIVISFDNIILCVFLGLCIFIADWVL